MTVQNNSSSSAIQASKQHIREQSYSWKYNLKAFRNLLLRMSLPEQRYTPIHEHEYETHNAESEAFVHALAQYGTDKFIAVKEVEAFSNKMSTLNSQYVGLCEGSIHEKQEVKEYLKSMKELVADIYKDFCGFFDSVTKLNIDLHQRAQKDIRAKPHLANINKYLDFVQRLLYKHLKRVGFASERCGLPRIMPGQVRGAVVEARSILAKVKKFNHKPLSREDIDKLRSHLDHIKNHIENFLAKRYKITVDSWFNIASKAYTESIALFN